jgi:hypothetical protein
MSQTVHAARRALVAAVAAAVLATPVAALAANRVAGARIGGAPACIAGTGYYATVAGRGVRSVTLVLDGRRIRTIDRRDRAGDFRARVSLTAGRAHRLEVIVRLTGARGIRTERAQLTLARCEAKIRKVSPEAPQTTVAPSFTG